MSNKLKILIACEFSGVVREAFRERGFDAYSCDLLPAEDKSPYHIMGDVRKILKEGWDLMIAHPPCTYLAASGNRWFNVEKYGDKARKRYKKMLEAVEFVKTLYNAPIPYVAIENPVGRLSTHFRKPDQYVQPYFFGDPHRKKTGLWLKNLPLLKPTNIVEPKIIKYKNGKGTDSEWHIKTLNLPPLERMKERSRTFKGFAKAMAKQWGDFLLTSYA